MHQIHPPPPQICVPQNLESRINTGHTVTAVVARTSPYVIVDFVYQHTKKKSA